MGCPLNQGGRSGQAGPAGGGAGLSVKLVCCYDRRGYVFWTLSLASVARSLTSVAACWPSVLTFWAASVAVALTLSMASWAGSLRSWAMVLATSVTWVARGWAAVLSWSAASRSFWLAGIREETSMPAPKAISPAARGLPAVLALTWSGAAETAWPASESLAETVSCAWWRLSPAECMALAVCPVPALAVLWTWVVAVSAAPMIFSFTPVTASFILSVWRWTMLDGVTLSATASTLVPRRARVASMSARMTSGFSLIGLPHLVLGLGVFLRGFPRFGAGP